MLPDEKRAAKLVRDLAHQLLTLDERIKDTDRDIRDAFTTDTRAQIIESLPGMGPVLGAEPIVGDLSSYTNASRLAAHAGLAPVPRDSGRRTGNYHLTNRHNRRLRHIFYLSAQTAMMRPGPSRTTTSRNEPKACSTQALLALARRRVDVLWAMLRDNRPFTGSPPDTRTT